jgi:hypothetical protein
MNAFKCSAVVEWRSPLKRPGFIYEVVLVTTGLNIRQQYLLSTHCEFLVWLQEQTATISLYGIKLLVFEERVYILRSSSSFLGPRRQPGSIPSKSTWDCGGQSNI